VSVPFDGFIATLIESVHSLEPLEIPLLEAMGCSVASDVVAAADMPASSVAKVDGYCVRRSDIEGASASTPVVLPIVADIEPGQRPSVSVQPGFGVRITAGSAIPDGTQCVVPTEWTDGGVARVSISQVPTLDDFIMPAGGVVKDSTVLVPAHTRLRSSHLGLIAAAGSDRVLVNPRPRVVVIPVGSELVEPGNLLGPGQVSEASGSLITAALRDAGALAFRIPALPTDARTLAATIEDQLVRADLVVLVDGAGARTRSVVRDVVNRIGGVEFTDLACEPIGVLGHGRVGPDAIPVVVVPSDPLAAYVAIEMILRPVVRRMLGLEPVHRPVIRAMLKGTIETSPTARSFIPATVSFDQGAYVVTATPTTGHPLIATSRSSAFAVVPEGVGHASDGLMVDVVVLERRFA
jgi:molybdopterin molybdotransferase